ncbi:DUF1841 family protein [Immundisolibacter sp.]|uniref:DUF1841 family protein n=1 Tax=Immundisolibacter sp. TaxID=1934948 RepID=UPI00356830E9
MFGQDRDSLRAAYAGAWQRHLERLPLDLQQQRIVDVLTMHPEYQALMMDPAALARDFDGSGGVTNPYLHMGLHVAIREQLGTGLPPEATQAHARLASRLGDRHAAEHCLIDCLAQTLWQAQRDGREPDFEQYREALRGL